MNKDMMVLFFQLAIILFVGALLSLLNPNLSSIGFIGWLVLFFKNVHLGSDAAFDEYKIQYSLLMQSKPHNKRGLLF